MVVSSADLFAAVTAPAHPDKLSMILNLKSHVKRDFVNIAEVPKYLEALSVAIDSTDANLSTNAFSVLCHMVKRVSIQDSSGKVLKQHSFLVLPILINHLNGKAPQRTSSRKALEAYWLLAPRKVEDSLRDFGFVHTNDTVAVECVRWLSHVVLSINPHFKLDLLLPSLVKLLKRTATEDAVKEFLKGFYLLKHNRVYRYDLQRELDVQGIPRTAVDLGDEKPLAKAPEPKPEPKPVARSRPPSRATIPLKPSDADTSIVSKVPNYALDTSIQALEVSDSRHLASQVEALLPAFTDKETETNWGARERAIVTLRRLVRGTASSYPSDLVACIRDASECVCKAITSLRTTLSSHGCQLVKELALFLKESFDPLVDHFLPTLLKLCSATKNIASTNANMAICIIFLNVSFSPRWFQKVLAAANEKNVSPRSYAGLWLQITLSRFANSPTFHAPHGQNNTTGVDVAKRVLHKILADANPTVRQTAKDAYWCFWSYYKADAEATLATCEPNVIKGVERAKPRHLGAPLPLLQPKLSRPSIKEAIMARNRELGRPPSRLLSRPLMESLERPASRKASSRSLNRTGLLQQLPKAPTPEPENARDPIVKFLSSDKPEYIEEGIHLLRYAIMGNEKLPVDTERLLHKISVENVNLLRQLFNGDGIIKKSCAFFAPEDFMRVAVLYLDPSDANAALIVSLVSVDGIYNSTSRLLSYAADISNIIDEGLLAMQFIRHKSKIVEGLTGFVLLFLDRIPISDVQFSQLVTALFDLVGLVRSTSSFKVLAQVLVKLSSLNPLGFRTELASLPDTTREDVESIVGMSKPSEATLYNFDTDLTRVAPGAELSPLKVPSDLTMLVPQHRNGPDSTLVIKGQPRLDAEPHFTEVEDIDLDDNHARECVPTDLFAELSDKNQLVEDFEQVTINPIQNFIDKVDPLSKISKNKTIPIFQDGQAPKPYDYSEKNWFNFQLTKMQEEHHSDKSPDELCQLLEEVALTRHQCQALLAFLRGEPTKEQVVQVCELLRKFAASASVYGDLMNGLLVLKQLLVVRAPLEFGEVWHWLCTMVSVPDDALSEMAIAVGETFTECLDVYPGEEVLEMVLAPNSCQMFVLESLYKVLSGPVVVDDTLILRCDALLFPLVEHPQVEMRRLVVMNYGRLVRASRVASTNRPRSEKNAMDLVMQRLPLPQQRLIQYYSEGEEAH